METRYCWLIVRCLIKKMKSYLFTTKPKRKKNHIK